MVSFASTTPQIQGPETLLRREPKEDPRTLDPKKKGNY